MELEVPPFIAYNFEARNIPKGYLRETKVFIVQKEFFEQSIRALTCYLGKFFLTISFRMFMVFEV